ncbi:MAG: iron ABC transporter substrate-binding protein [Planctomycetota bacterium]
MPYSSSNPKRFILPAGLLIGAVAVILATRWSGSRPAAPRSGRTITDAAGREVSIPDRVERVLCSGPGSLRLLTYLGAEDLAAAVDDAETRRRMLDARPYALAHPQFKSLPTFGEFRGHDNPELIVALSPSPQVIFKTYATMGYDPHELQAKTGVPVVVLDYGDLSDRRAEFYDALRLMGDVIGRKERAEQVVAFFDRHIRDLEERTRDIPAGERLTVYIGGVAHKGPHGYRSTEPAYPPFRFVHARNVVRDGGRLDELQHSDVAKEKILEWDPDVLFLDLSTLQLGDAGGLGELKHDPAYATLTAVREGRVYGLLPYNWYTTNYGSLLANAYFIGKVLYPDQFRDLDPSSKADAIYSFLVGEPVFGQMDRAFGGLAFRRIPLED